MKTNYFTIYFGTLGFSNNWKRRIIMISLFNKKSVTWTITALSFVLMVGCSSTTKTLSNNTIGNKSKTGVSTISKAKPDKTSVNSSSTNVVIKISKNDSSKILQQDNSQKILLESIKKLAEQGKIINCDFPAKSTNIGSVQEKWGKADKSDWVPQANGVYDTYSKYNVVFGFNKGDQIFEVRSFDNQLGQISLSMVKNFFGTPAYDVKSNGEETIGYTAGKEFKILFVFSQPAKSSNDSILNHYSVFYPAGTIDTMANYSGREW